MKTSELTGVALDWAVAKCEGLLDGEGELENIAGWLRLFHITYSTDWAQGGPIVDREMSVKCGRMLIRNETYATESSALFSAEYIGHNWEQCRKMYGPTPLIAAMRCFVASKLGDEVEIPKELL